MTARPLLLAALLLCLVAAAAALPSLGSIRRHIDREAKKATEAIQKDKDLMRLGRSVGVIRKPRTKYGLVGGSDPNVERNVARLAELAYWASLQAYDPSKGTQQDAGSSPPTRHIVGCKGFTIRNTFRGEVANAFWVAYDGGNTQVLAFRGSDDLSDVKSDVDATPQPFVIEQARGARALGAVQRGTLAEWMRVKPGVMQRAAASWGAAPPNTLLITGHSLGGAMAHLAAATLAERYPALALRIHVITFGSPRVGNKAWQTGYHSLVKSSARIEIHRDPAPDLMPVLELGGRLHYTYRCPETGFTSAVNCHRMPNYGKVVKRAFGKAGSLCRA